MPNGSLTGREDSDRGRSKQEHTNRETEMKAGNKYEDKGKTLTPSQIQHLNSQEPGNSDEIQQEEDNMREISFSLDNQARIDEDDLYYD